MSPDRLKHELASAFKVVKDRCIGDEICILCPIPGCADKSGNRFVNVKTLYTNCWRCEAKQPHHVKGLFRAIGLNWEDDHVLEPSEVAELLRGPVSKALTPVQDVPLPVGFEPLTENRDSCYWKFCKRMAERKHLEIEDLEFTGAGFTREGAWEPFCIFPVYEGPRMAYYQGRTYTDDGFDTTKKFPNKRDVPYGANYWVHGLDELADDRIHLVVLVESILNRLSLNRKFRELNITDMRAVCVFTHFLSRAQTAKMLRYRNVTEWCILFDSDSTALAHRTAVNLSSAIKASVAEMPFGSNKDGSVRKTNDANDDVETALKVIESRRRPDSVMVLRGLAASSRKSALEHGYSNPWDKL